MCCMFENELEELGQNDTLIHHSIDASLVKIIKKRRNLQDDSDFDDDDKLIIKQQYQKLCETEKACIIFELLRDCGDFPTVVKVLKYLVTDCNQGHEEIIRQLDKEPELKAWLIKELKNDGKGGCCKTYCLSLNKPWLNFKRIVVPLTSYAVKLISFHLDYWKDLVVFLALRHYCTSLLVRIRYTLYKLYKTKYLSLF